MSQTQLILEYIRARGSITPMEALDGRPYPGAPPIGCFRLAARIEELRRSGHSIKTTIEKRNGRRWARYVYEQRPQQAGLF